REHALRRRSREFQGAEAHDPLTHVADVAADLRFAWRLLAKDRRFTAGAIFTLALAMGVANTTFIGTYAVLWRDFPFERPDRIAIMRTVDERGREAGLSFADY